MPKKIISIKVEPSNQPLSPRKAKKKTVKKKQKTRKNGTKSGSSRSKTYTVKRERIATRSRGPAPKASLKAFKVKWKLNEGKKPNKLGQLRNRFTPRFTARADPRNTNNTQINPVIHTTLSPQIQVSPNQQVSAQIDTTQPTQYIPTQKPSGAQPSGLTWQKALTVAAPIIGTAAAHGLSGIPGMLAGAAFRSMWPETTHTTMPPPPPPQEPPAPPEHTNTWAESMWSLLPAIPTIGQIAGTGYDIYKALRGGGMQHMQHPYRRYQGSYTQTPIIPQWHSTLSTSNLANSRGAGFVNLNRPKGLKTTTTVHRYNRFKSHYVSRMRGTYMLPKQLTEVEKILQQILQETQKRQTTQQNNIPQTSASNIKPPQSPTQYYSPPTSPIKPPKQEPGTLASIFNMIMPGRDTAPTPSPPLPPPPPPPLPPPLVITERPAQSVSKQPETIAGLLADIQKGTKLKKVNRTTRPPIIQSTASPRDELMDAIRSGITLRKVPPKEEPVVPIATPAASLLGSLASEIEKRRAAVAPDNVEDDSEF